jgi:hypothetical protein
LFEHAQRARNCRFFAAEKYSISVEPHDDRNQRLKRRQVLIVLTENAQRIDGSSELENFFAADLLDG